MTDAARQATDLSEAIGDTKHRERRVKIRGETILVRPMRVRQLARFMPAIAPVLAAVNVGTERAAKMEAAEIMRLFTPKAVIEMITAHHEPVLAAAAAAVGKDADWLAEAELDELCELVTAVTMVNLDFFVRRLIPTASTSMHAIAGELLGLKGTGVGRIRSRSSSQMDTG